MVPDNIISATFMLQNTVLVPNDPKNLTLGYRKVIEQSYRINFLGLCVFSLILGFAVLSLESKAKLVREAIKEINDIIMGIIMALMK